MPKIKSEAWDLVKGVTLLSTLMLSGAFLGYVYRGTEIDRAHAEEVQRLQSSHYAALDALAGRIGRAAEGVADAAQVAQEAAGTADKAATLASRAATKVASKVSTPAAAPADAPGAAEALKAETAAINHAVRQANSQMKEKKK